MNTNTIERPSPSAGMQLRDAVATIANQIVSSIPELRRASPCCGAEEVMETIYKGGRGNVRYLVCTECQRAREPVGLCEYGPDTIDGAGEQRRAVEGTVLVRGYTLPLREALRMIGGIPSPAERGWRVPASQGPLAHEMIAAVEQEVAHAQR